MFANLGTLGNLLGKLAWVPATIRGNLALEPCEETLLGDLTMKTPKFTPLGKTKGTKLIEGSLEAKLPTIWKDGNGTARQQLGREES